MIVGLIPVFITAGLLESFVTRYTGMPIVLSLTIIGLSGAFILWYYVWLPHSLFKKSFRIKTNHLKKTMNTHINVKQTRTVGDVLTDTFTYIRIYYKSLATMIAVYVLAPLMVGSIIISSSMGAIMTEAMAGLQDQPDPNLFGTGLEFFAGFFFLMIAYLLLMGVIYQHIYYAGEGDMPDNVSEFSKGMFSKLLRFIPFMILLYIIFIAGMVLIASSLSQISFFMILLVIPLVYFCLFDFCCFQSLTLLKMPAVSIRWCDRGN